MFILGFRYLQSYEVEAFLSSYFAHGRYFVLATESRLTHAFLTTSTLSVLMIKLSTSICDECGSESNIDYFSQNR